MSEESSNQPSSIPCIECRAGVLTLRHITYFTWLGGELITVPNFPAWICDVCGRREYDEKAIHWLNMILGPERGETDPTPAAHASSSPPADGLAAPASKS